MKFQDDISNMNTHTHTHTYIHTHIRTSRNQYVPHFFKVGGIIKLGFTRVCIFYLILLLTTKCGYLLEPPQRGVSNVYPQSMF